MTATAALLSGFAIKSCFWNQYVTDLTAAQLLTFLAAVVAFSAHTLLQYNALEYTTIANAIIYGNSQALLLIIGKACVGEPVSWLEGAGVVTAFSGAILCTRDSEESAVADPNHNKLAIFGDLLALASALAGVAYLTFAKAVRQHISVTLFIFLVMFLGSWLVLLYMLLTGVTLTISRDPNTGVFGWITMHDSHLLILLHIAAVCNVCGTMGFVRAMQYFDNIIIAVATLLEPMLASMIACAFHVGLMPGPLGYVGNALVTLGTIGVVAGSKGRSSSH
jgi:drug/metabolite transporter (DMT)-like permease